MRKTFNAAKAGHGGTLDPIATGVLPIAFGTATKALSLALEGNKSYRFRARWGIQTTTDDRDGEEIANLSLRPDKTMIETIVPDFIGEIIQVPPIYSAVKMRGQRSYALARAGKASTPASRKIMIFDLKLIECSDQDHAVFEVVCSKGSYMRSLARDLGRALGTLAHVVEIRRLRSGPFSIEDSISLEHLQSLSTEAAEAWLKPINHVSTVCRS